MSPEVSNLINGLKSSELVAQCPYCQDEFSLADSTLFDGLGEFPESANQLKTAYENDFQSRLDDFKKRKVSADEGSEKKAIEVGIGKIIEKVLPAYKNFTFPLSDCRFLAEPLDAIIFDGASSLNINKITFMEIKTGNAKLNTHQRRIRDAIKDGNVKFEVF